MRSATLTVLLALMVATAAGAQPAAAAKIRQVPPLALDLPAAGRATGEIIQRLLTSAEVPFGLEQAPEPADAQPPDPGRDRQGVDRP